MGGMPFEHPAAIPFLLPKLRGNIFDDSFCADANGVLPSGWALNTGTAGSVSVQNGSLSLSGSGTAPITLASGLLGVDCFCAVRFSGISNGGGVWGGAAVRIVGQQCYSMLCYPGQAKTSLWYFAAAGGGGSSVSLASVAQGPAVGQGFVIYMDCVGETIRGTLLYGSNSVSISVTDTALAGPGSVGITANTATIGTVSMFRGLRVR